VKAIKFYLEEHPLQINDMLSILRKMDHTRAVTVIQEAGHLPLVRPYLIAVQQDNIPAVNEALNQLYIEEEDFQSLNISINNYDKFDNIALAKSLENHQVLDFRRIAASLYRKNQRWKESMELSKKDKVWEEAMHTATTARSQELSENLLRFFVEVERRPECFASCLFICYDFIRPDVALELAWKHKMMDSAMPYFIQVMRHYFSKVNNLAERAEGGFGGEGFTVVGGDPSTFQSGESDPTQIFPNVNDGFFPGSVFSQVPPQMLGGVIPPGQFGSFMPVQSDASNSSTFSADPSGFQSFGSSAFGSFH